MTGCVVVTLVHESGPGRLLVRLAVIVLACLRVSLVLYFYRALTSLSFLAAL